MNIFLFSTTGIISRKNNATRDNTQPGGSSMTDLPFCTEAVYQQVLLGEHLSATWTKRRTQLRHITARKPEAKHDYQELITDITKHQTFPDRIKCIKPVHLGRRGSSTACHSVYAGCRGFAFKCRKSGPLHHGITNFRVSIHQLRALVDQNHSWGTVPSYLVTLLLTAAGEKNYDYRQDDMRTSKDLPTNSETELDCC